MKGAEEGSGPSCRQSLAEIRLEKACRGAFSSQRIAGMRESDYFYPQKQGIRRFTQ